MQHSRLQSSRTGDNLKKGVKHTKYKLEIIERLEKREEREREKGLIIK